VSVEAEVLALSAGRDAVLVTNDARAVASYLSDDWVYVGPAGPAPKADIVDWIATGRLAHHSMRAVGEQRVAVHGGTAIVTAHKLSSGTWEGAAYDADEWISEVYVRRSGRWICVFSQKCRAEG
jgi:ketosteroid isomerase-like protein